MLPYERIRSGEIVEAVYAKNTVPQTVSGKTVSRGLRAHLLVEFALTCVLLDKCISWKDSQDTLRLVFSNLQQGELSIDEVNDDVNVSKFQTEFETGKLEHCHSEDVLQSRKNQELDYALRMYTQNVEFVCRYGSYKLRQECHIVLADYVEPTY